MIPNQTVAQSDNYLLQRIIGATPEQLCVLLLEGAQRFLLLAIGATKSRNVAEKAKYVNRVSAIIEELMIQLNHDEESELVINLSRIYEWWMNQIFEASRANKPETLELVYTQIGDIKATWEQLVQKNQSGAQLQSASPPAGGLGTEFFG